MGQGCWGRLQALVFIALVLAIPASAGTVPTDPGPSTLVWDGDVHLTGPTWIPKDTLLLVEPGTRILPQHSLTHDGPAARLVVEGDLIALGEESRPISFLLPVLVEGRSPGPTVVDHALFAPTLPGAPCALALGTTEARVTNTTFTGATDGLCLARPSDYPGDQHPLTPESDGGYHAPPAEQGAPTQAASQLFPPPPLQAADMAPATDTAGAPVTVPQSTILLASNHYENNTGTGLNLTRPTVSKDTTPLAVISDGDQVEGNDIGILLGDPGLTLSLSNATVEDNRIGLMADGGDARLDHVRFDQNSEWDTYATSDTASIQWTGSAFEPACAHVEGRATYGCERGSVGGVTVLTILLGLIYSLVFLLSEAGRYVLTRVWVWLRLYSRIPREELLDHETRQEILAIVGDDPGIHLRAIEREVGGYGKTYYHLARLEREGFLKSRREGIYRRFYPVGFDPDKRGPRSTDEHVYDVITRVPGIHGAEIARRLDTSRQSVAYHIGKLLDAGVIEAREGDRIIHLFPRGHR